MAPAAPAAGAAFVSAGVVSVVFAFFGFFWARARCEPRDDVVALVEELEPVDGEASAGAVGAALVTPLDWSWVVAVAPGLTGSAGAAVVSPCVEDGFGAGGFCAGGAVDGEAWSVAPGVTGGGALES